LRTDERHVHASQDQASWVWLCFASPNTFNTLGGKKKRQTKSMICLNHYKAAPARGTKVAGCKCKPAHLSGHPDGMGKDRSSFLVNASPRSFTRVHHGIGQTIRLTESGRRASSTNQKLSTTRLNFITSAWGVKRISYFSSQGRTVKRCRVHPAAQPCQGRWTVWLGPDYCY
jgi:hypothetical protein